MLVRWRRDAATPSRRDAVLQGAEVAQVIGVFSQKGGVGKSTLVAHGGVVSGWHVETLCIDADPQGTLTDWSETRQNERGFFMPAIIKCAPSDTPRKIRIARENGAEIILVDMAPRVYAGAGEILAECDFVLVPTAATMPDLRATDAAVDLIVAHGKPFAFVLNMVREQSKGRIDDAKAYLVRHMAKPKSDMCPHTISRLDAFADALIDGLAITEYAPGTKGVDQVVNVWNWVFHKLGRNRFEVQA